MTDFPQGHILIVDDEPTNLDILVDIFDHDYEITVAVDGLQAIERAHSAPPDLILLDVIMPGMDGYEVCARLKRDSDTADIPVIFVTGRSEEQAESQGLDAGAVDYVTKPIIPKIVRRRVSNHIELKKARDCLTRLALLDALTGLNNRRSFDQALELECQRLRRAPAGTLSLLLLDIDHFKRFNDTYGHLAGDACLKRLAGTIAATIRRATDFAGRYGGEEFVCILPQTPSEAALDLAQRIRGAIEALAIPHAGSDINGVVTASLGVVTVDAGAAVTPGMLVAAADTLLYGAKNQGRNRVVAAHFPNEFSPSFLESLPMVPRAIDDAPADSRNRYAPA